MYADFRPYLKLDNMFNYISLKKTFGQKFRDFANDNNLLDNGIGLHVRFTDKKPQKNCIN